MASPGGCGLFPCRNVKLLQPTRKSPEQTCSRKAIAITRSDREPVRLVEPSGRLPETRRQALAFRSPRGPRPASLDRIARIVIARRRGMAGDDQPVDQRFILGGEAIVERAQIIVP